METIDIKNLDRTTVKSHLSSLNPGTKLRLTFKKNGTIGTTYLLHMIRAKIVAVDQPMDEAVLWAVSGNQKWDGDRNRIVTISLTETFTPDWFMERIYRELEGLDIID